MGPLRTIDLWAEGLPQELSPVFSARRGPQGMPGPGQAALRRPERRSVLRDSCGEGSRSDENLILTALHSEYFYCSKPVLPAD